jgi:glycosyltransferase involved in cell wall biosynthesis
MRALTFAIPGDLNTPTGGYAYDRQMIEGLRRLGWSIHLLTLDSTFPHPTPSALTDAAEKFASVDDGGVIVVDGLALSVMPDLVEREASRLRIAALVHLPLAADPAIRRGVRLQPDHTDRFEQDERRALTAAALIVVTGRATIPMLDRYQLAPDRLVVVEPGTPIAPMARGSGEQTVHLLSVGTLNAGKGHEILIEALAGVHPAWQLTCVGSLTRDPETARRVRDAIRDRQLETQVTLFGEADGRALEQCYDRADVFVLATLRETYGMAVAEALAHGLPIVSTRTGAIAELVDADAGLLTIPGDIGGLRKALTEIVGDVELRKGLAEGARRRRTTLKTWDQAVGEMASALSRLYI